MKNENIQPHFKALKKILIKFDGYQRSLPAQQSNLQFKIDH